MFGVHILRVSYVWETLALGRRNERISLKRSWFLSRFFNLFFLSLALHLSLLPLVCLWWGREHYGMCLNSSRPHGGARGGRSGRGVTFSARAPDINAVSRTDYHGNISHSIKPNKLLSPPTPPPSSSSLSLSSSPPPELITQRPLGHSPRNDVSSRPSYFSRIA